MLCVIERKFHSHLMRKSILAIAAALLISCHAKEANMANLEVAPSLEMRDTNETSLGAASLIKTAHYRFQVLDVHASTGRIESVVRQHEAFVADMNLITSTHELSNAFTIRVPAARFEKLLDALGQDAVYTHHKKIDTEDVSEEFVDLESRLKTKKEVRDRYVDILKTKAKTVQDVLKAEEQIRILQEEIEAKEGRLRFLQNRVSHSTIHLEIYQPVSFNEAPDMYQKSFGAKVGEGLSNGWAMVTNTSLLLINIWPLLILAGLVYWRRHWIRARLRTNKHEA